MTHHLTSSIAHTFIRSAIYRAAWHMPVALLVILVVVACLYLTREERW